MQTLNVGERNRIACDAQALAEIARALHERPMFLYGEPLSVSAALFERGADEMRAIMRERGFGLPVVTNMGQPNFILYGTPIVVEQ